MTSLRQRRFAFLVATLALTGGLLTVAGMAQTTSAANRLAIQGYVIDAELDPTTHHLSAKAQVTFTAAENSDVVSFGFHPALKLTKVSDDAGKLLTGDRSADGAIRIAPVTPFVKGQAVHWTFEYQGTITGNEDGPEEGLKLAAIQEPVSYLLYPGRWFPMTGYLTNRFTAEMHIKVPQGIRVLASGSEGSTPTTLADGKAGDQFNFKWTKPGFPGTVIAGRFVPPVAAHGGANLHLYLTVSHQGAASELAETASKEFDYFTGLFGGAESSRLNVVEIAGRYAAGGVGSGAGGNFGFANGGQVGDTPAGQHHCAPVVGVGGEPGDVERRVDHQRHVAVWRADVCRGREWRDGDEDGDPGCVGGCAGL